MCLTIVLYQMMREVEFLLIPKVKAIRSAAFWKHA